MLKINGFTEEQIINKLYLAIDLAGDGGPAAFNTEEYNAMQEYLSYLESNIKSMDEMNKPETEPIIIEDNNPCINYRNQESGWTCRIYAVRCDGISCKDNCDWYNKSSLYTSK
jgi:hypothetical protein